MPKLTLDQIAKLYELEPWQRELLEDMLRADERGWREREEYRARLQAMTAEVGRQLEEILDLPANLRASGFRAQRRHNASHELIWYGRVITYCCRVFNHQYMYSAGRYTHRFIGPCKQRPKWLEEALQS